MANTLTRYDPEVHPALAREALVGRNITITDLARVIGVSKKTLYNWMNAHPEFLAAVKESRQVVCEILENSMFKRANGYEYVETEVVQTQTTVIHGENLEALPAIETKTKRTTKFIPPEVGAGEFLLANWAPDKYKRRGALELTGKDGGPIEYKNMSPEELRSLGPAELARLHSDALAESANAQPE